MTRKSRRVLSTVLGAWGTAALLVAPATQPSVHEATGLDKATSAKRGSSCSDPTVVAARAAWTTAQDGLDRQRVQLRTINSRFGTPMPPQSEGHLCTSAVIPEEFRSAYPKLRDWIQKTLSFYEKNAQPVASMHFGRLPLNFDRSLLETVKFIAIDRPPMPPLTAMGLSRFSVFERGGFDGITYLDRYFLKQTVVSEEPLHFHELIHVIQWRLLGPERFLAAYAGGLDEFGYENSPLERMAYDAEAIFKGSSAIFNAEKFVAEQLGCP
jgi:hypothetical protein